MYLSKDCKFQFGENRNTFVVSDSIVTSYDILDMAKKIAKSSLKKRKIIDCSKSCKDYIQVLMQDYEHEVFMVVALDSKLRIIDTKEMFRGTINTASVYPREVAKYCLKNNAASLIVAHNHPSGIPEPSRADIELTKRLKESLSLVDVALVDHIVVGKEGNKSMSEMGLI